MVEYSPQAGRERDIGRVFAALADPTRRAIVQRLARGPANVSTLARPFRASLQAVSKHLRVLEQAGLVRRKVEGRVHRCELEARPLEQARNWIEQYHAFWECSLEALGRYMEETADEEVPGSAEQTPSHEEDRHDG